MAEETNKQSEVRLTVPEEWTAECQHMGATLVSRPVPDEEGHDTMAEGWNLRQDEE